MKTTNTEAIRYITQEMPFKNTGNTFRGVEGYPSHFGMIYGNAMNELEKDKDTSYTIYSYSTPIAWKVGNVWKFPKAKYSNTTSKHKGKVRKALELIDATIIEV